MRPQYEVADIFRLYGKEYRKKHKMSPEQHKAMAAIMSCRTAVLGGHEEKCNNCGITRNCYNSCRNRHCPKCQTMTKERWLDNRKEELLPCGYFHLVFTLPHDLNQLILFNRKELMSCLFMAVKNTLFSFAADPQWKLEGTPGILTVLHTWSQTLIDHFHLHCLIPAGVLAFDKNKWVASNEKFLFREGSLAKEFKKQYLGMVEERSKYLRFSGCIDKILKKSWKKKWVVYAKKPFAGPEQVLEYLGRYTHRIAISNHRIKSIDQGKVSFTYKDRSDSNRTKHMTLDATEFIRRFLLHVLPKGFMKIRYYGFLANICKKRSVLLIRRLIGKAMEVQTFINETFRQKVFRLTGRDILLCPHCRKGIMVSVRSWSAWDTG